MGLWSGREFWQLTQAYSGLQATYGDTLLETEPSLSPALDYGTVCHQTLSRVTLCHGSGDNLKHSSSDSPIPLF